MAGSMRTHLARVVVALSLALVALVAHPEPAGAQTSLCDQALPAATDGALALDQPEVVAGGTALGVLSDFAVWPAGIVGGGSGETFLSCTPWAAEAVEVMVDQDAALLLVPVPAGTAPGTYEISVVFQEGSLQPSGDGQTARLTTSISVTATAVPAAPGPACALDPGPAPAGAFTAPATAVAGTPIPVSVGAGAHPGVINEYDRLWYLACLDGVATPITGGDTAPASFEAPVPAGTAAGDHDLRVIAVLGAEAVAWDHAVTVAAAVAPTTTTTTAPEDLPRTGPSSAWPWELAVGLAAILSGLAVLRVRRRLV